ncbi:MAG: SulP family inorganic anion transporter [Magnetococcales bacterium]|nr:SulP family inorganic anion transporter [Magnetococcales bacterium]
MVPDFRWLNRDLVWRHELFSGVIGAVLVIPQAITFAYLAGLPPEYGIYSAIYVTLFACLLGRSSIIGGPNTAVAILIGETVIRFAGRGSPLYIDAVLILSFEVGVIQLLIWLLRGGRLFQYFSPTVILGITTAVGAQIIFSSLEGLTGAVALDAPFFFQTFQTLANDWGHLVNAHAFAIGMITVICGWWFRIRGASYFLLAALVIGSLASAIIHFVTPQVITEVDLIGRLPFSPLPFSRPTWEWDTLMMAYEMLPAATTIAIIGLAQTMVIAKEINLSGRDRVDFHKETFAQGVANLLSAYFSGFAGSGSFNRTASNHDLKGRTPLPGIVSSVVVLVLAWNLGDLLAHIPMAVMAGVLFIVGLSMIKPAKIRSLWLIPREFILFLATFLTIIFLGLSSGVIMAAVLSLVPFLLGAARLDAKRVRMGPVVSLELYGNLFFASVDSLSERLHAVADRHLILNLRHVSFLDHGAAEFILQEQRRRDNASLKMVVFTHLSDHQSILETLDTNNELHVVSSLPEAREAMVGLS